MKKRFFTYLGALVVLASTVFALNGLERNSVAATVDRTRDCDQVAIIKCGAMTEKELLNDYDNHGRNVKKIFAAFGISRADIANGGFKHGIVWRDGRVTVDGKTVATDAMTAGRNFGGTPIAGTNAGKYPTSKFVTDGQTAFVKMKDGRFQFAVLKTCGNPVTAKPKHQPQPFFKCKDLQAKKISRTSYRFEAQASAGNGARVVSYKFNFGDGKSATSNDRFVRHDYAKAGTYTVRVSVVVKVNGKNKTITSRDCVVKVNVPEKPVKPSFRCEDLTSTKISRTKYTFAAQASASGGAEITGYRFEFGDGNSQRSNDARVTHQYAEPGDYTAQVHVTVKVNGQNKTVTSEDCKVRVNVPEKPVKPVFRCDELSARLINETENTYRYQVFYTADGGAELRSVDFDFGDGQTQTDVQPNADGDVVTQHSYTDADASFTTTATLHFNVAGNVQNDDCKVSIETAPTPCPTNPELPKDSPDCAPCPIPGFEDLPADSPNCVKPEQPEKGAPEVIAETGPSEIIGGTLGLGMLTAAGYHYGASRRNLLAKLLGR